MRAISLFLGGVDEGRAYSGLLRTALTGNTRKHSWPVMSAVEARGVELKPSFPPPTTRLRASHQTRPSTHPPRCVLLFHFLPWRPRPMLFYAFGRRALELVVWGLTSVVLVQSVITPFLPQVRR